MKKGILALILFIFASSAFPQTPNWQWVKRAGGPTDAFSSSIATDAWGNTYVSGGITSSANFGTFSLSGDEMFLVKYDSTGTALWGRKSVSSSCNGNMGGGISVDAKGNCYMTGSFSCNMSFGGITLHSDSFGGARSFIVKYSPSGSALWARNTKGTGYNNIQGYSTCTDANGNVYITGMYETPNIIFGTDTLVSGSIGGGTFLTKYDSSGNLVWTQGNTGSYLSQAWGNSVRTDAIGSVYLAGSFKDTVSFGNNTLMSSGGQDMYLTKYNASGNVIWAKGTGGQGNEAARGVSTDLQGNIYIGGDFDSDTLKWSGIDLVNDSAGAADVFIVKLDSAGNMQWAKKDGSNTKNDYASTLSTDSKGTSYICGVNYADSNMLANFFLSAYDPNGNLLWVQNGANYYNSMGSVCTDLNGNGYVTGIMGYSVTLGSYTVSNLSGGVDLYVGKFNNQSGNSNCTAYFNLYPDATPHNYTIVNMSTGAAFYTWNWGDGTPNDTGLTPSHVYAQAGFYNICLSIVGPMACTNSYCYPFNLQKNSNNMVNVNVQSGNIDVETHDGKNIFSVYPNPAAGSFAIRSEKKLGDVSIENSIGQSVYRTYCVGTNLEVDLSKVPSGIYLIRVLGGSVKFIKN